MSSESFSAEALLTCARPQIQFLARQLQRKLIFRDCTAEDLQQELSHRLLTKAHLYDPSRGAVSTFIKAVLNSAAAMMIREGRRFKRAPEFTNASLDDEVREHNGRATPLGDAVSSADRDRRTGNIERISLLDRENAEAIQHAIANLSPQHAALVRGLLEAGSISGAAQSLGIRRARIHEQIPALRIAFEALRDVKD